MKQSINHKPKVSVVIPVYNAATTLSETLASVFSQSIDDLEVIAIDDGSTDQSVELLRACRDPRFRYVQQANAGAATTRNHGLHLARAPFIAFLDADDYWAPDKLQYDLQALEAKPECAMSYSWVEMIDSNGASLFHAPRRAHHGYSFRELLEFNATNCGSNAVFRREMLLEVNGFDERLKQVEDWDLILRVAYRFPITCSEKPCVFYRLHNGNKSGDVFLREKSCLNIFRIHYAKLPYPDLKLQRCAVANLYKYFINVASRSRWQGVKSLTAAAFFSRAAWYLAKDLRVFNCFKAICKALLMLLLTTRGFNFVLSLLRKFRSLRLFTKM